MGEERVIFLRLMMYEDNEVYSFKAHPTYEAALDDAVQFAALAGKVTAVYEHKDSSDQYVATVYCEAGVAHVIKTELM